MKIKLIKNSYLDNKTLSKNLEDLEIELRYDEKHEYFTYYLKLNEDYTIYGETIIEFLNELDETLKYIIV